MRSRGYRWNVIGLFTLVGLLLASCNMPASTSASVWLDVPTDGLTFPAVQEIKIEGHASGAGGVSRVEIWINGALTTTVDHPPMEGELAAFHTIWAPPSEGIYAIQTIAFSSDGVASEPDSAVVTFGGEPPTAVAGCPSPVGGGPTPVSCEPTVMVCPSPVGGGPTPVSCEPTVVICPSPVGGGPTPVSCEPTVVICPSPVGGGPTPVSCEPPVAICPSPVGGGPTPISCAPGGVVKFWADPAEIAAGACTQIRWHAENVGGVVFGGVSQPLDGSYEACLCENERYTLRVTRLDGTEEQRTLDVAVSGVCETPAPPAEVVDTNPPPAPEPAVPANGLSLGCRASQTLAWLPVSDDSGIAEYRVQVQRQSGDNNWQDVPGSVFTGIGGKQTGIGVECGWYYRWRVRALDGAGNLGSWSDWSEFSVTLS